MKPIWRELMREFQRQELCDLAVGSLDFTVVTIDLDRIGELTVAYPYHPDYPDLGAVLHVLSWESFGMEGLN